MLIRAKLTLVCSTVEFGVSRIAQLRTPVLVLSGPSDVVTVIFEALKAEASVCEPEGDETSVQE